MDELRTLIHRALDASQQPDLSPHVLADLLVKLTVLYASLSEELLAREFTYRPILHAHMLAETAASRAKIKAETTSEYRALREAQVLEKVLVEHIRSLKKSLSVRENDRWHTR